MAAGGLPGAHRLLMYLLDTDWAIQALGHREPAARTMELLAGSRIHVSLITIGELYDKAFVTVNPHAQLMSFRQFLLPYKVLNLSDDIMERFAEMARWLPALPLIGGRTIPWRIEAGEDAVLVGVRRFEVDVRVRVHEVDALDDALDLDGLRTVETAEPVMRERRRRNGEQGTKVLRGNPSQRSSPGAGSRRAPAQRPRHRRVPPRRGRHALRQRAQPGAAAAGGRESVTG